MENTYIFRVEVTAPNGRTYAQTIRKPVEAMLTESRFYLAEQIERQLGNMASDVADYAAEAALRG